MKKTVDSFSDLTVLEPFKGVSRVKKSRKKSVYATFLELRKFIKGKYN